MADMPKPPIWRPVKATRKSVSKGANQAIEQAYRGSPAKQKSPDTFLLGSDFDNDIFLHLPRRAPNKRFGNYLLDRLKGISRPRQPDIVDFEDRTFFEIKPAGSFFFKPKWRPGYSGEGDAVDQLRSLYKLTDAIRQDFGSIEERTWSETNVSWMPPKVLPMPGNPKQLVVTVLSELAYKIVPGLIVYQVWETSEAKKKAKVAAAKVNEKSGSLKSVVPSEKEMVLAVKEFDEEDPDYVILVPRILADAVNWEERFIEKYGAKVPPFLDRKHPVGQLRDIGRLGPLTPYAPEIGIFCAGMLVGLGVGGALMILTAAGVVGAQYIAAAGAAGAGAAGGGGGAVVINLASRRLAAELAKAAAGVLLVVGTVAKADAKSIEFSRFDYIRIVPDSNITPYKGTHSGQSNGMAVADGPEDIPSCQEGVEVDDVVLFDSQPYVVAAKVTLG